MCLDVIDQQTLHAAVLSRTKILLPSQPFLANQAQAMAPTLSILMELLHAFKSQVTLFQHSGPLQR